MDIELIDQIMTRVDALTLRALPDDPPMTPAKRARLAELLGWVDPPEVLQRLAAVKGDMAFMLCYEHLVTKIGVLLIEAQRRRAAQRRLS